MLNSLRQKHWVKRILKSHTYVYLRQFFPMAEPIIRDDRGQIEEAEDIVMDWPAGVKKPLVGIIRDYEECPRWTKYIRFLETNAIPYDIYSLHSVDWIERATRFDVITGIVSNEYYHLQEMRKKFYILEQYLGKKCYPSTHHMFLYENKTMEAEVSKILGIPFAPTHVFHDRQDALRCLESMRFPVISKIDPGSGSVGVEWVNSKREARQIIQRSFSRLGRSTYSLYFRQKQVVYFQEYIPNDGYDIRVEVVGNMAFGYYRRVLDGDFRASGMNQVEWGSLPEEAVRLAWDVNRLIQSPLLVVDMVHGQDGRYYVIEFSPICRMDNPAELQVDGVPGVYLRGDDGQIRFEPGKYWLHELALREFFLKDYLPGLQQ